MLTDLSISNFILIDHLQVSFTSGFTTITGETGAGKSIFVGALSMLLGKRGDSSLIRNGAEKCIIEASFSQLPKRLNELLDTLDLPTDTSECILRREITASGRSRAFVNDTPTSLANLSQVALQLIDIHSQHRNLLLSDGKFQLTAIDRLLPLDNPLQSYKEAYSAYLKAKQTRDEIAERIRQAAEDYDNDSFRFSELDNAHLIEGEEISLHDELDALEHAEEIKQGLLEACRLLQEDEDNIISRIASVEQTLGGIRNFSSDINEYVERISRARIDLADIAGDLIRIADDSYSDPDRLTVASERYDLLNRLMSKYHTEDTASLISLRNELASRISLYESGDLDLKQAEKSLSEAHARLLSVAKELHEVRLRAAKVMASSLSDMLHDLEMPHATVKIEVTEMTTPTPDGIDSVTLLFSANCTLPPQPVGEIASGGEISRLMLALKALLAEHESLPTILFDEVDTGVSGRTADKMGQLLLRMGHVMQVIAITHLPQIAARSVTQMMIYKKEDPLPQTILKTLSTEEREQEIARLLSGHEITPAALKAAQALLNHND